MALSDILIKIAAQDKASKVLKGVQGKISRLSGSVKKFTGSFRGLGVASVGVGAAAAFGVKAFAKFDQAMASVSAVSGATGKDLEALREKAKELGSSTKFTATQAAEGMKMLGMAGFDTKQILDGIGPTLSLAAAGALELGEAADIASDVSSAYGLSAEEIARVADVIATTATSANTNVHMMGETFKFVAPIAKVAGQSIEETSVAIGLLGNAGIKASMAGTDIKNLLTNLAKPSKDGAGAIKRLGLSMKTTSGEFKPLMDIMRDFGEKTKDLTGPEKLSEAVNIFGKRSAKSAIILSDVASPAVTEFRNKLDEAKGSADKMAETMQDNLGGAGVKIASAFEGVQIAIAESLEEPLKHFAESLRVSLSNTTEWVKNNKTQFAELATSFGDAGGAILTTAGLVAQGIGAITIGVGALIAKVRELAPKAGAAIGGQKSGVRSRIANAPRFGFDVVQGPAGAGGSKTSIAQDFGTLADVATRGSRAEVNPAIVDRFRRGFDSPSQKKTEKATGDTVDELKTLNRQTGKLVSKLDGDTLKVKVID